MMKIIKGRNTITTKIAYIAGFFDGEGCVRIKQANQGGKSYYVIAHITNTNRKILEVCSICGKQRDYFVLETSKNPEWVMIIK